MAKPIHSSVLYIYILNISATNLGEEIKIADMPVVQHGNPNNIRDGLWTIGKLNQHSTNFFSSTKMIFHVLILRMLRVGHLDLM